MSQEEFLYILKQLQGQTSYIYYHLMGEPLMHPSLPAYIKLAGEGGFKSIITTNGTLLKKRGAELLSAGVHKVNISLHSFEQGSEEAHKAYLCELAAFAKAATAQGTIVVLRLWNKGFDGGKNESALDVLKAQLEGEWGENSRGIRVRDKLFLEWGERFEWPDEKAEPKGDRFFCYGLKDQFGILCDGTVVPCCLDSDGVISLGNVFEQDLEPILNSPRAKAMVEGFKCGKATEDLCRRCGYAQKFV